jgi:hypothetical protein
LFCLFSHKDATLGFRDGILNAIFNESIVKCYKTVENKLRTNQIKSGERIDRSAELILNSKTSTKLSIVIIESSVVVGSMSTSADEKLDVGGERSRKVNSLSRFDCRESRSRHAYDKQYKSKSLHL